MAHSLLISDIHLCASQTHTNDLFTHFVQHVAPSADTLFILGDLFEYWAGDDDLHDPYHNSISEKLRKLSESGTAIFLMHGNRDFLMAETLAASFHATLLSDPTMINLYDTPTLLSHGDGLCTDDVQYQQFRQQIRSESWKKQFVERPLPDRKRHIEQLRRMSEQSKVDKIASIMDVNDVSVAALLREYNYPRLIHGHTHRPARHLHQVDGHDCARWVLGDWYKKSNALRCDAAGIRWEPIQELLQKSAD
ncbi:MAG: UDP-2,3-diacylglucosamine diphosphatase [Gallionella sp.]